MKEINDQRVKVYRDHTKDQTSTDQQIKQALRDADAWIKGRKWSATIVAHNILKDGYPHP